MIRWASHRPAVIWAASATILLAGAVSFTRLALATKTTIELPELQVSASWSGASAELVEMYVTSPIEAAVQGVRGVRRTSSESRDGSSSLRITLDPKTNVQLARLGVLERLELLRTEFPPGVTPPRVSNYVPEALDESPLVFFTVNGPYTPGALQKIANEQIAPRIAAVAGVAGVDVASRVQLGVAVSYDAQYLRQVGVSPQLVGDALRQSRLVQAVGEERFGAAQREIVLRDEPDALEEVAALPIRAPNGRMFRLGDLATIRPDEDTRGSFMRIDGQPAIAIAVSRLAGADAIRTAAGVKRAIDELGPTLPTGIHLRVVNDESIYLSEQLGDLVRRGALAFLAVVVVLAVTMRSVRAIALVMASAAVAIAGTALGLYLFDIPANLLTLAGLGMGIGVLVQNGLVVVERLGTAPSTADGRAEAARRIFPAVLGATLTTAVVLLPFLYLQGNARAAFFPFAAAFALGLGWSVVSAVVMIPAIAGGASLGGKSGGGGDFTRSWPRLRRAYRALVVRLLRWKWGTLAVTVALLAVSGYGFYKRVPRWSFGDNGERRTRLQLSISFPRGSDPESLDGAIREFERFAVGREGVEQVVAQGAGSSARMSVLFSRASEYTAIPELVQDELTQRAVLIGGASISVQGDGPGYYNGGGSILTSNRIKVLGYSYAGVEQIAKDIAGRLEQIPRVREVRVGSGSFWGGERAYQVTLEPDRAALARYGLTATQFASAVAREVNGPVGQQRIEIAGEEVPVTVKSAGARERSLEELESALLPTATTPVRIADVSRVSEREVLSTVVREDQQYVRVVSYDFRGPAKLAQRTHESFMNSIAVPAGYRVGDQNTQWYEEDRSDRGLWLVFAIGVVLVILSVAMVFDSVWAAGMVFLTLPVALAGVTAAFWAFRVPFSREATVGVILVVGLAVNQGILFVDAALERRRRGGGWHRLTVADVVHAALDRSGMIVLVTLSTMASLIPLAAGTSTSDQFGSIALGTAGGTIAGTLGAMLVLPVLLLVRRRGRGEVRGG